MRIFADGDDHEEVALRRGLLQEVAVALCERVGVHHDDAGAALVGRERAERHEVALQGVAVGVEQGRSPALADEGEAHVAEERDVARLREDPHMHMARFEGMGPQVGH